jgi:radical SAM superfamily enzyme YgiQ (UPF0313 family)
VKILLVGVNAKFVQTNLAIRLLRAYALRHSGAVSSEKAEIICAEWNINQPVQTIVRGVFESGADVVAFSTYIWNRSIVFRACAELRLVCPDICIGLGGPEVSWAAEHSMGECTAADFVIAGEGEETLVEFIDVFAGRGVAAPGVTTRDVTARSATARDVVPRGIRGVYSRCNGGIVFGGSREPLPDLGEIPFPYSRDLMDFDPANRIVYYESSRGCPFSCAYCLSSVERSVRYYPLERVLGEIGYFMEEGFPLVKFTDRTFNLASERYLAIWKFIRDHYNGKTLFHFEISAELLGDEAFAVLETMPVGSVQFEIGIQSTNPETLRLVGRHANIELLSANIRRIPSSIHTHVDLIAGLPAEDLSSFARSFDYAFSLDAGMLQLGFLKILAGSPMAAIAQSAAGPSGFAWSVDPPYEVLRSPALPYRDMLVIKDVECLVDAWYNSGLLRNTLTRLVSYISGSSAFALFRELASFVRAYFPDGDLFLPRRGSDVFACVFAFLSSRRENAFKGVHAVELGEWLRYDFLLQGKPGSFPSWYERRYSRETHDLALSERGFLSTGESRRTLYARTEYDRFVFSAEEGEVAVLFEYFGEKRNEKRVICHRV